jgi:acyl transferase domain-containing protein/SAM-dependent methyltransferase/NAD(P)-dependent dehydrogenase (short-subunit alcohol dehydrogenase family)
MPRFCSIARWTNGRRRNRVADTPIKRALLAVEEMRRALDASARARREPIAIVGMGCRFPGAPDTESFRTLLIEGRDAIGEIPRGRWDVDGFHSDDPDEPGKILTRYGGFLEAIDQFDARFFGIAPREAASTDPQQRLLLEVVWQALEDAGIPADSLAGAPAGVFIGLYNNNYTGILGEEGADRVDAYSVSGTAPSIAAGRISYTLGLRGPALAIDTACSSSMVAVHLAVQSLRSGESSIALAGGVNLILSPLWMVGSSKLRVLAPDGRCKTFDADADGFGQAEGCGIVVLKRLSDAQRDGDRIVAVIRGTAVNQDGRSAGLTAPSGEAQEEVIRAALRNAGLEPADVDYVEAHGTGTKLGDPIEVGALAAVFGGARKTALGIGSVKTNIGHCEAAAGIAGLIKMALALDGSEMPAQLHFKQLNPLIDIEGLPIEVVTSRRPWPRGERRRVAGISSFGFSGTNAHVILDEAPLSLLHPAQRERPLEIVTVSAKSDEALAALQQQYSDRLRDGVDLRDFAHTANAGRNHFGHRIAAVGRTGAEAAAGLGAAKWRAVVDPARPPKVCWLYPGQGSQYAAMGTELSATHPIIRRILDRAREILGDDYDDDLTQTRCVQPALFAVEWALTELWRSWGVRPDVVAGHSAGEFAAACAAGVMSWEDGLRFVARRGALMSAAPGRGSMAAVLAEESRVRAAIAGREDVSIAAINGDRHVVISGTLDGVAAVVNDIRHNGIHAELLEVEHAFHSALMEPILDELEAEAARVAFAAPSLPWIANVTGAVVYDAPDANYWRRHVREPVQFASGIRNAIAGGCTLFIEVGPGTVLTGMAKRLGATLAVSSIRRERGEWEQLLESLAALYVQGANVDWAGFDDGYSRRKIAIPSYPFQRQRYWNDLRFVPAIEAPRSPVDNETVFRYYDALAGAAGYEDRAGEGHLTFGVFPQVVPAFSWLETFFRPQTNHRHHELLVTSQKKMKSLAFRGVDFDEVTRVMDFGCGHAADLTELGVAHPNLELHGYTLSAGQVEVGRERIARLGLAERAHVYQRDSANDAFPGRFDLIFGFEVLGLIEDRPALFRNIATHLNPGGRLVIVDFIAVEAPIHNPQTSSYTDTKERWSELLAAEKLRVLDCVDVSPEIGNFLLDPDYEHHVAGIVANYGFDEITERHLRSQDNIGKALRGGVMQYVLLTAQRDPLALRDDLLRVNLDVLAAPKSYAEVIGDDAWFAAHREPWRDWLYDVAWRRSGVATEQIAASAASRIESLRDAEDLARYDRAGVVFQAMSAGFADAALRELGDDVTVLPRYERLLPRLREIAAVRADVDVDLERAVAAFPRLETELRMLDRCGRSLAGVLRGEIDPLQLIFPDGASDDAEQIYRTSPYSRVMGESVAEAVRRFVEAASAPVRLIEIGGGTGGTTTHVLPVIDRDRCAYTFTDVSSYFVQRAARTFASIDARVLDIERDPIEQGLERHGYDIVIAANVIHATADLAETLAHIRSLLRPGGLLLLVENTGRLAWGDLTFGLTEGWWRFRDHEVRDDYPLLTRDGWISTLTRNGFGDPIAIGHGEPDSGGFSQQALFVASKSPEQIAGRWLVVDDISDDISDDIGDGKVSDALRTHVEECVGGDIASLTSGAFDGVIHLGGLESALATTQAILAKPGRAPRLILVARGSDEATLLGFGKVLDLEYPDLRCTRLDLDDANCSAVARAIANELALDDGEQEVAYRGGVRHVALLERLAARDESAGGSLQLHGTYLVTGGLGGLGTKLAAWLVDHGADVVLNSRHASDDARRIVGSNIRIVTGDIADAKDAQRIIDFCGASLRGVVHAAGVLDDGAVLQQSWSRFESVLAPKVAGTINLHRLTQHLPLDHFVLFSSSASLLGSPGQSNHAAANAFLDAFAAERRRAGLPALSINWGAWGEVGAAMRTETVRAQSERRGVMPMEPAQCLEALDFLMRVDVGNAAVVRIDWSAFKTQFSGRTIPRFYDDLLRSPEVKAAVAAKHAPRIEVARPIDSYERLFEAVTVQASRVLGFGTHDSFPPALPLTELGLDSLMAVELRNALARVIGSPLPATLLFDYPSADALTRFIAAEVLHIGTSPHDASSLDDLTSNELAELLDRELAALPRGTEQV